MARLGDLGWAGSGIWARREGLEKGKKVTLGRKWVETGDEENPPVKSCGRFWRSFWW